MIYTWVVNTGQNRSIMTFFELTEGDLVQGTGEPILISNTANACLTHGLYPPQTSALFRFLSFVLLWLRLKSKAKQRSLRAARLGTAWQVSSLPRLDVRADLQLYHHHFHYHYHYH